MIENVFHPVFLKTHFGPENRRFLQATSTLKLTQLERLSAILASLEGTKSDGRWSIRRDWSYEDFSRNIPLTDYLYWEPLVEKQKETGEPWVAQNCIRYEPTSGSTSKRKWIPYTQLSRAELDRAIAAWLGDLYVRVPGVRRGKHYWSVSWLPDDLRKESDPNLNDDSRLFSVLTRFFLRQVMAVPSDVGLLSSSDEAMLATAAYLAGCPNLTLLSIWSPTFGFELLEQLSDHRKFIAETLARGKWSLPITAPKNERASALLRDWDGRKNDPEFFKKLWPSLALVSSWDSSTSSSWAAELAGIFPHAQFQAKGIWATEGVFSIPVGGVFPLAVRSHFYEFRCLDTGEIVPSWKLKLGQKVQPILTSGNGLLRYVMQDQLRVNSFLNETPCFVFLGRLGGTDLVGEKLDTVAVTEILQRVSTRFSVKCVTLLACSQGLYGKPEYVLWLEGQEKLQVAELQTVMENELLKFHHYRVARELHQIAPVRVVSDPNALKRYLGMGGLTQQGSRKVESLTYYPESERPLE